MNLYLFTFTNKSKYFQSNNKKTFRFLINKCMMNKNVI